MSKREGKEKFVAVLKQKPRASWLSSSNDSLFAAAMSQCKGVSGNCASDGVCEQGGKCFIEPLPSHEARIQRLEKALMAAGIDLPPLEE